MTNRTGIVIVSAAVIFTCVLFYFLRPDRHFLRTHWNYSIGIYTGTDYLHWVPAGEVQNPVLSAKDVTDTQADFIADPFMVHEGNTWFMFFEVFNSRSGKGEIGYATSGDGYRWTYERIILAESIHLSNPYIFKWNDAYYMIPESSQAHSVRLYRADNFPTHWTLFRALIDGSFTDAAIIRYGEKWWLFATQESDNNLRLFYSDELTGSWAEHPLSPVVTDSSKARPAGRMIVANGKVVRYAQDDGDFYGKSVRAFIVDELTTSDYREHEATSAPILQGTAHLLTWLDWNAKGMHAIDPHEVGPNKWLACVDGFSITRDWKWKPFSGESTSK